MSHWGSERSQFDDELPSHRLPSDKYSITQDELALAVDEVAQ